MCRAHRKPRLPITRRRIKVILERIPAREQRFPAPPTAIPTGSANPADALARLRKAARGLIEYLEATPDAAAHPAFPQDRS